MDVSPSFFDPDDLTAREQYRRYRYRKRQSNPNLSPLIGTSSVEKFSDASIFYDSSETQRPSNSALLLEEIKQEIETCTDIDGMGVNKMFESGGFGSARQAGSQLVKVEEEGLPDEGTTFSLFSSLLDSALQGLMPFSDLILHFEKTCRDVSESIRYGSTVRHRVVEDKFMRQKARLLIDEAASWSLLWYIFGKGNEELPSDLLLSPPTSHQESCKFVREDQTAQLFLRIVMWLEGLASEALDLEKKVRGSHVGSYLPSSGVWHHTQRFLKRKNYNPAIVQHMDFDAPTREEAQLLPDDKKQDELLLEDVWTLLRAGRLEEACELCRSAGQAWRAATLCPFGGLDLMPSIESLVKNGKERSLQALELESRIGHQFRLWKWASYCASEKIAEQDGGKYEMAVYAAQCSNLKRLLPICTDWESACWAMAKSWLDVKVDQQLSSRFPKPRQVENQYQDDEMIGTGTSTSAGMTSVGPESWPYHVLDQQPRDVASLLQKLHSSDVVHEAVSRACRDQHRKIQMNLMLLYVADLLDLIWSWISPSEGDENVFRPSGDPEMMRFGAHLVLVLRYLVDVMEDDVRQKLETVGDRIIQMYAMYLFSQKHEDLVGIYASQLARRLCVDLFVQMMELRLNSSMHVKYKLFLSAVEYLPYTLVDKSRPKACFEEIIERVLARSREAKVGEKYSADVAEQHRLQSLEKAMVIQWLCFTPPTTIPDFEAIRAKLLFRALIHSNTLFREFALISMWRVPEVPIGAHELLAYLAEPLQQPTDNLLSLGDPDVHDYLHEFEDWREYYSWDATYRKWLKLEMDNSAVPPEKLSEEEKDESIAMARQTLSSALALLQREANPWLDASQKSTYDSTEQNVYLELRATAMLCLPTREAVKPDATHCTALTSALYSSVSQDDILNRRLTVNVSISSSDSYCIEVTIQCVAVEGDGLGFHESNDGGLLAAVMADAFKGELTGFQTGVAMEISRLDASYSAGLPAAYIIRGLCRRCCLPEIILRCMQVSVYLCQAGDSLENCDKLVELVACSEYGFLNLFSQNQLKEFFIFERECLLHKMEHEEEDASA